MSRSLFLVDTSVWLDVLRPGGENATLRERIASLLSEDQVATTGMVLLELLGGARSEVEYQRLSDMVSALHSLPAEGSIWEKASRLAFGSRRRGITVPFTDLLIATVALESEAILLHRDRHYDALASHTSLQVESYV